MANVISRPLIIEIDSKCGSAVQGKVFLALSNSDGLEILEGPVANDR
jgi:hypothetical protein